MCPGAGRRKKTLAGSKDSSSLVADFEFHYGAMQWSVVRLPEPISLSETDQM